MFVGLHADLRIEMFVVVTTFYTLDGMKSILLPKICIFSFKATPFSQKYKFIILLFYLLFTGVALRIITYPAPSGMEPLT